MKQYSYRTQKYCKKVMSSYLLFSTVIHWDRGVAGVFKMKVGSKGEGTEGSPGLKMAALYTPLIKCHFI